MFNVPGVAGTSRSRRHSTAGGTALRGSWSLSRKAILIRCATSATIESPGDANTTGTIPGNLIGVGVGEETLAICAAVSAVSSIDGDGTAGTDIDGGGLNAQSASTGTATGGLVISGRVATLAAIEIDVALDVHGRVDRNDERIGPRGGEDTALGNGQGAEGVTGGEGVGIQDDGLPGRDVGFATCNAVLAVGIEGVAPPTGTHSIGRGAHLSAAVVGARARAANVVPVLAGRAVDSLDLILVEGGALDEKQMLLITPEIESVVLGTPPAEGIASDEGGKSIIVVPQTLAVVVDLHARYGGRAGPIPGDAGVVPLGVGSMFVQGGTRIVVPDVGSETPPVVP